MMNPIRVLAASCAVVLSVGVHSFADGMPEDTPPPAGTSIDVPVGATPALVPSGAIAVGSVVGTVAPPFAAPAGPLEEAQPTDLDSPAPQPPLDVLLAQEPSRGSFKLAEQALDSLRQAARQVHAARDRYELTHVDYDGILAELEQLTHEIERTFRPDREPGDTERPFYPAAHPLVIDGRLWRIGHPTPP